MSPFANLEQECAPVSRLFANLQNMTSDGIREEKAGYNVVRFIGLLAQARDRFGPQAQRLQSLSC